jgi:hypothetical protein
MSSNTPFTSITEMEMDPNVKPFLSNITNPKEIVALRNMITQPKNSNIDVVLKFQEKFQKGELKGMSPGELNEAVASMNKTDRTRATKMWEKYNSPQTTDQERSMMNNMTSVLNKQLQAVGYVKSVDGRFSNKDKKKMTESFNELIDQMDNFKTLSYDQQVKYVQDFANKKKKDGAFAADDDDDSGPIAKFKGFFTSPKPTAKEVAPPEKPNDADVKMKAIKLYIQKNKRTPNPTELNEFIEKEKL